MKTAVIFFPFDLFGSSGTAAGAQLLADECHEMLADNKRERVPTRARAYTRRVTSTEFAFEKLADYQNWRSEGRCAARETLDRGDFLLWIAGNHLGVLPVYDELSADPVGTLIVQCDAHLDIHQFSDCTAELSHGNFLRHSAGPPPPVINVGHRDLLLRPEEIRQFYREAHPAEALAIDAPSVLNQVRAASRAAERVFFDIDCDVFDPAYFPAAAQPVPFGLSPSSLLRVIDAAWSPRVAGVMISEFDPSRDQQDRSLALLVWLLEYLLLKRHEKRAPGEESAGPAGLES